MKGCKVRLATSLSEKFVSIIAFGTFRSGCLIGVLMTFLSLAGSAELDLPMMADGSTTWSREWLRSGANRRKGTSLCSNFAHFMELSGDKDNTMGMDGIEITKGYDTSHKQKGQKNLRENKYGVLM